jgi:hypothetical protein
LGSLILYTGDGDKASLFSNSHVIDNADSQVNPANSGTSKEQSDDDGDFEETADPANAKKMRRYSELFHGTSFINKQNITRRIGG